MAANVCAEVDQHIAAVEALYAPLITGENSRLEGGATLWNQFKDAVSSYEKRGRTSLPRFTNASMNWRLPASF